MLLRDSCATGPQAALTWQTAPAAAYKLLIQQYSHSPELLRNSLSRQYQALNFNGYEGSLADFNVMFNSVMARLTFSGFNIDLVDKVNQYFKFLEVVFPLWAERQRSFFRTMRVIGALITALNLEFFMADILEEQRNLASITSKRMYVHRANRPFRDPTRQNKGPKCIESFRLFNCRWRFDRGSSYNTYFEDDEEGSKDAEIELELEPELQSFICVMGDFDLDDNKSSCSISFWSFKDSAKSVESAEIESGYLVVFNKSKRPLKRSPNRPDLLLYDIGTIDHIVNDRKWFKDDYTFNRGQLRILKTGGGPVAPKSNGTAVFIVLSQVNPPKYREVVFEDALYLPDIDVNLFNGLKYYKSGGYLQKNRLYTPQGGTIAKLNIVKTGFFIPLKGPKSNGAFTNFCYGSHRDDFYIFISVRPLKAGLNKSNVSEGVTLKLGLHRLKDRHRSVVLEGVTTGNNGFRDPSSWESTERGPCMLEDRLYEPVESQEVTIGSDKVPIGGLNLK